MDMHDIDLSVTLEPIWHDDPPLVEISCGNSTETVHLKDTQTFTFKYQSVGPQSLVIKFLNKKDNDTVPHLGLDKAVRIKEIGFFGIADPKFIWAGEYRPIYPEPWVSEQRSAGNVLNDVLNNTETLSWNGEWKLSFNSPVFTWIHQLQDLGWIYN